MEAVINVPPWRSEVVLAGAWWLALSPIVAGFALMPKRYSTQSFVTRDLATILSKGVARYSLTVPLMDAGGRAAERQLAAA